MDTKTVLNVTINVAGLEQFIELIGALAKHFDDLPSEVQEALEKLNRESALSYA